MTTAHRTIWTAVEWQGSTPTTTPAVHKDVRPVAKPEQQGNIDTN